MADPIQRTSTVPVPDFHTVAGQKDPLPLNAPKEHAKTDDKVKDRNRQGESERFETYLNQSSISTLEKNQESGRFDPAREIAADSPYSPPPGKTPF